MSQIDNLLEKKTPSRSPATLVVLIVLVAILLVAGVYYWGEIKRTGDESSVPSISTTLPYTTLPLNKIPDAFPYDIPMPVEPPNLLLLSYSQTEGNKEQTTIQFISSKSAAETLELYKKYFKDKGWTIAAELDQDALKSLSAKKERTFLNITINSKGSGEGDLVDLTIIVPIKAMPPSGFNINDFLKYNKTE